MRWFSFRSVLIGALAVAAVGFLLIDDYFPRGGVLWNVMNAEIPIWETCPETVDFSKVDPSEYHVVKPGPFDDLIPQACRKTVLPYRWLLAGLVVLVGAAALLNEHRGRAVS